MAKVLVVDDEIEILNLVCDELKRQGHDPIAVKSPIEALEMLKYCGDEFELLICDVIMPHQNGLDFVREVIKNTAFDGKIAIMSSYTTMLTQEIEEAGIKHVLKKPFNLDGIIGLMNQFSPVLDS
ncbi:MAG: response regulator [Bacteriovoracia bacterium]